MEEKYKIHACYIIGILLSIIITLVTIQWSGIPNLAEKISFALTLASLILAALAIGYAVYSNTSFSQTVSTLNNVSRDVSDTAKDISKATDELTRKIEAIPSKLESMEDKVAETNVLLKQYAEKNESQPPSEKEQKAASEIADLFISRVSIYGLILLYAYSIVYSNKKPLDLSEFSVAIGLDNDDYVWGNLNATYAAGLIDYTYSKQIVNITDLNEKILNTLQAEITNRVNSFDENDPNNEGISKSEYATWVQGKRNTIDQFFNIKVNGSAAT